MPSNKNKRSSSNGGGGYSQRNMGHRLLMPIVTGIGAITLGVMGIGELGHYFDKESAKGTADQRQKEQTAQVKQLQKAQAYTPEFLQSVQEAVVRAGAREQQEIAAEKNGTTLPEMTASQQRDAATLAQVRNHVRHELERVKREVDNKILEGADANLSVAAEHDTRLDRDFIVLDLNNDIDKRTIDPREKQANNLHSLSDPQKGTVEQQRQILAIALNEKYEAIIETNVTHKGMAIVTKNQWEMLRAKENRLNKNQADITRQKVEANSSGGNMAIVVAKLGTALVLAVGAVSGVKDAFKEGDEPTFEHDPFTGRGR
ncbi:MAG: hypothetical protein ACK6BL_04815 [Holosporaceae bacterium]